MVEIERIDQLVKLLLPVFKNGEMIVEFLIPCIQRLLVEPRYELISMLDVLYERILDNEPSMKAKIMDVSNRIKYWILGSENKNFTKKYWNSNKHVIPKPIKEIFMESIGSDINKFLELYMNPSNEDDEVILQTEIEERTQSYINNWISISSTPKKIFMDEPMNLLQQQVERQKQLDAEREFNKDFKTSFKDRERTTFKSKGLTETEYIDPLTGKVNESMTRQQKFIDLKYVEGIDEVKKSDKERFVSIFYNFEKETGITISEETKRKILNLWHGEFYDKSGPESDDIMSVVEKYNLKARIPKQSGETSKIILQSYIVGLILDQDIYTIYSVVNDVSEEIISPDIVYDKNNKKPSSGVLQILNPIFENINFTEELGVIRINWEKMIFPDIDISRLINRINKANFSKQIKYKIIAGISELTENISTKGLTIEKFAKKVYDIIDEQHIKKFISVKEIMELLNYKMG